MISPKPYLCDRIKTMVNVKEEFKEEYDSLIKAYPKNREAEPENIISRLKKADAHKKSWPILRALFSRSAMLILFTLIQLIILIAFFRWMDEKFAFYIFIILSALEIIFILNQEGSSVFKISWIVPIMLFPVFGALFYLFLKFQNTPHKIKKRLEESSERTAPYLKSDEGVLKSAEREDAYFRNTVHYIDKVCGFPPYKNTSTVYFPIGEEMFPILESELKKAKRFIFMEYFIIKPGVVWDRVLEILKAKAAEGVEIRLMYDGMNCIKNLRFSYPDELICYGIKAKMFSPIKPALETYQNNRDHRKICVIDGNTAFTGGLNLANEYANIDSPYGVWKDTGMMFKGEAVNSFTMLFLQMWNITEYMPDSIEDIGKYSFKHSEDCGDDVTDREGYVIPYGDSPFDKENIAENVYLNFLNTATEYVHIRTPYLILDDQMINAMCYASKRGVDVKIMFPHIPDKPYAFWLAHSYYPVLIKSGVKIYEYRPGFVHAKEFVADGTKAVIGTVNLDFRSLYLHFENAVYLYKNPSIADMEEDFQEDLKKCICMDMEKYRRLPKLKLFCGRLLKLLAPMF